MRLRGLRILIEAVLEVERMRSIPMKGKLTFDIGRSKTKDVQILVNWVGDVAIPKCLNLGGFKIAPKSTP